MKNFLFLFLLVNEEVIFQLTVGKIDDYNYNDPDTIIKNNISKRKLNKNIKKEIKELVSINNFIQNKKQQKKKILITIIIIILI